MDKLTELKELVKGLSSEELEELKTFLAAEAEEQPTTETETEETPTEEVASEETEEVAPEEVAEETVEEENSESNEVEETEETPEADEEETAEESVDEVPAEETPTEEQAKPQVEDDDVPMTRMTPPPEEETQAPNITTEDGGELPVDYQEIIDGLNAKLLAKDAEIKALKNKYEGAFGYSAKPDMPAKVNRLYDDCEDVHFHR